MDAQTQDLMEMAERAAFEAAEIPAVIREYKELSDFQKLLLADYMVVYSMEETVRKAIKFAKLLDEEGGAQC